MTRHMSMFMGSLMKVIFNNKNNYVRIENSIRC